MYQAVDPTLIHSLEISKKGGKPEKKLDLIYLTLQAVTYFLSTLSQSIQGRFFQKTAYKIIENASFLLAERGKVNVLI